jgi:hypothetical protein
VLKGGILTERILTLHPQEGKQGTNIDRSKYNAIRAAILDAVGERPEIAFGGLADAVAQRIGAEFEGSVSWYVTTIKLDLEARGLIERVPGRKPQFLRLVGDSS